MELALKERIEEIEISLLNNDLNRAGQRLLDLTYDYQYRLEDRKKSLELRERYNGSKKLGKSTIDDPVLLKEYNSLVQTVLQFSPDAEVPNNQNEVIARIDKIGKTFRSRLHNFQFNPISLELFSGKIVGVVGENGNGKTTLLRMICGDLSIDEGDIEYVINGESCRDWQAIKKKIAFIPQRLERWYGSAEDKISFEAAIKGFDESQNKDKVDFIIHRMGLSNFRELSWTKLSSGYKLRFEIAIALVSEPSILVLDEPLANLDLHAQQLLLEDLKNLAVSLRTPVSIILTSQQLHEVETIADQIIFLKNGRAVYNGSLKEFRDETSSNTFEVNGNFSYKELQNLLKDWTDIQIEQTSTAFVVNCSKSISADELIKLLLENKMEIDYFRNISGSTKKLFNDKY
ncbi:MAG: ATP-binding cassette domain-containing protein [Flavobacteriales bacterium]|nr:ATP-binding cassette domain-containing protein [Flavobacteriales bacterium]